MSVTTPTHTAHSIPLCIPVASSSNQKFTSPAIGEYSFISVMLQMGKMMCVEVNWKADHVSSFCQGLCRELHLSREKDLFALLCVCSQLLPIPALAASPCMLNMFVSSFLLPSQFFFQPHVPVPTLTASSIQNSTVLNLSATFPSNFHVGFLH